MTYSAETGSEIIVEPAGPVVHRFMDSEAFVRGIMGPFGSGKSTGCVFEILRRSQEQAPSRDGKRKTRWAIIRNSYPELKTTTIKTWNQWCPAIYGKLTWDSPITHHVKTAELDMEVFFIALDREEDVRKLLSLELTGAWLNEVREIPKAIFDGLTGRVGRFPTMTDGGCTWSGIIMDTNPPDDQHWYYKLAEEGWPQGFEFYKQPSGLSPEAENLKNLPKDYYQRLVAGKDPDWVKVYVHGEYGLVTDGKAVFPMFRDRIHTSESELLANPNFPLFIGVDFGLTPAAVIGQKLPDGRWHILDELITDGGGVIRFSEKLAQYLAEFYPDHVNLSNGREPFLSGWGDPAGNERAATDERTCFEILKEYTGWGIWRMAPTNDISMRLEVVCNALNRLVDGNPGLLVSPKAKIIRKGFAGGYHYKPIRSGNGTQFHDTPNKNQFSHPHDALQYLLLGGGEADVVMRKVKRQKNSGTARMAKDIDYQILG